MFFKHTPPQEAVIFKAPPRPEKKAQPVVLTPDMVKSIFAKCPAVILNDGPVPIAGKIIGWKTTDAGTLGAVVVNPITDLRYLYGVDFRTGRPRQLGKPWSK